MKVFNKILYGATFALLVSSCSEFMDINDNPNNPDAVTPELLLPTGLTGAAFANNNELNRFGSTVISVTAGAANSPSAYDVYDIDSDDFGNQWRFELYSGSLIAFEEMIRVSEEVDAKAYSGIGKIMKAYAFALTTDTWGDIPYSEALGGLGNTQPALDSQEDIYKGAEGIQSLFDLVREGIADLGEESSLMPGQDDIVYGGDLDQWRKAGYTLMLKMAITISYREPALATTIINEVLQDGELITSNVDDLNVRFGMAQGSYAPAHEWTNVSTFAGDLIISTRFVNLLQSKNDPRLPLFVTAPTGSYVTIDNGFAGQRPLPQTSWSRFSSYVTGNGAGPVRLVTNFQRAFNLAEAVVRLGVAGDANEYYQEGIRASMSLAGLSASEIDAYFAANADEVNLTGNVDDDMEKIITQKYIAWFGNGVEQWTDWRRTGFPTLAPHQNAGGVDPNQRPLRAQYISQEINRNPNFPNNIFSNVPVWWNE
ncbi:SusD/RagB family nutrient-binding outer membrane lipoprotein [Belliella kenyensis]|uniref:SusD/RagB family nutrient-binding outer membrane lipoprotein n=1 Tax=Belliella kenyensis TaxID=1472724 RepID=A0ABV8EJ53_9BACT|nr:SusD/RagB family nutrient-binding outer membrane lipoprotein [Belliella kenyensis]MCH7402776.1 SusD/RagB family nutrient-binding outer membrane lipoprotein [Belliella kenyensis]MDN3603675.1 SusD/RagB family nutrient-binding outer membrane lipoprotein [Belliella kenyensis]